MAYPGAVLAGEALSRDRERDVNMQRMLEAITEAQMKRQQEQEDRQLQIREFAREGQNYLQMQPPAPPSQAGAQPPAPGQPSMPMGQPPIAPMMPAGQQPGPANVQTSPLPPQQIPQGMPQGMPPMPPQGPPAGPPPGTMVGSMPTDQAALARMKMLDRAGIPAAIGVGQQPVGYQPMPGGRFAPQPPAPPASDNAINTPPMNGGGPQDDQGGGLQPAKIINAREEVAKMVKGGMDPFEAGKTALAMQPIWDRQNKYAIEDFTERARIARETIEFRNTKLRELTEQRRAQAAADRAQLAREKLDFEERGGVVAARERYAPAERQGEPGVAGAPKDRDAAIDFYAEMQMLGDTSWRTGLSRNKSGSQLIEAVDRRVASMSRELGVSPGEIVANKGATAGALKALIDRTKFVAAGNQYVKNLQSQADLVEKYMDKGAAGGVPALNKWIQSGRVALAGDPDVTALDTAIRGLAREHQRIVTGVTSNAQLHVKAQETADELLNRDQTPAQMRATIKVMREEADNAIAAGRSEIGDLRNQIRSSSPAGGAVREFASEAEAEKAGLKPGTRVKIGGQMGTWQ